MVRHASSGVEAFKRTTARMRGSCLRGDVLIVVLMSTFLYARVS
jgi:hypothetical protein